MIILSDRPIYRSGYCLCCGSGSYTTSLSILSSFLSSRAFNVPPNITLLFKCLDCGFRWSERGLSNKETSSLYVGYRDETYFIQRSAFEPWYSREINDGIGSEFAMPQRRKTLIDLLEKCNIRLEDLEKIADHGGDRGQMLLSFSAPVKKVYDISGANLDPGIERIKDIRLEQNKFDLVLTCHVLEHLNDPKEGLLEALSLVKDNGLIYLELPHEAWLGPYQPSFEIKCSISIKFLRVFSKYYTLQEIFSKKTALSSPIFRPRNLSSLKAGMGMRMDLRRKCLRGMKKSM